VADARKVALDALIRIEQNDSYANLALGAILERSKLDERDRRLVTELVYGVTRMRRACDFLVDRFLMRPLDLPTRSLLRLGAYQLHFMRIPAHAAVSATVEIAPRKTAGLVNAVLRRVSSSPVEWPDDATRLSYPDWLVQRLIDDLGRDAALAALAAMNEAPEVTERADGYVQDRASQWVAALVETQPGERVADLCAAPGGKATALDGTVVASDVSLARSGLVRENSLRMGSGTLVVTADARHAPYRDASFDRVLVDAPCSGLGVLRRRPDARWRIDPSAIDRLVSLQREIVEAALRLLRPGGVLVYSVCTVTRAETIELDEWLATAHPELDALPRPGEPWRPHGRGGLLLPHEAGTDGMAVYRFRLYPSGGVRRDERSDRDRRG
jgi:16S rRNA (cytosine967-C5)-methyltransferase